MRSKLHAVTVPCALLSTFCLLQVSHPRMAHGSTGSSHHTWSIVVAAILPLAALLADRKALLPRLPLCLLLVLLLSPADLRHDLLATTPARLSAVCIAIASMTTILASFAVALAGRTLPLWLKPFAIESNAVAALARSELRLAWFALMRWRPSPSDRPAGARTFPANSTGTDVAMAWVAAASALIEAPLFHLLLMHVSPATAWVATGLSFIGAIYCVGLAKSLALQPTLLFPDKLVIRLGALASSSLQRAEITQARLLQGPTPRTSHIRLFAFDKPNIAVEANGKNYLFRVDHPKYLLAALQPA